MIGMFTDESGAVSETSSAIQRRRVINFSCQWPVASFQLSFPYSHLGWHRSYKLGFWVDCVGETTGHWRLATGNCFIRTYPLLFPVASRTSG